MNLPQVWWNNDLRARGIDLGRVWMKEVRENGENPKRGRLVFKFVQQTKTTSFWSVVRRSKSNDRSSGPSAGARAWTTCGGRGRQARCDASFGDGLRHAHGRHARTREWQPPSDERRVGSYPMTDGRSFSVLFFRFSFSILTHFSLNKIHPNHF